MKKANSKDNGGTIALNKKARHDYFIQDRYEAGIALQGWEVKSLRAGKCQLVDSYVLLKDGEAFCSARTFHHCKVSPRISSPIPPAHVNCC